MASQIVSIDTQILIWGVRADGPEDHRKRARSLFSQLKTVGATIIIPSVAVAEFLIPIADKDAKNKVMSAISESFAIMPFDARCCELASTLYAEWKPAYQDGTPGSRDFLKADAMIVATAKIYGASIFYSDDKKCREMASQVMEAKEMPFTNLFGG